MHELIVNDWLDHDYIARHVDGWPALRERALAWPPERAAAVCGIDAAQVRSLARDYGTIRPAAIRLNYGMQRVRGGGNAAAADRDPAVPGRRLAASRRRPAAVERRAGSATRATTPRCSGPTCSPGAGRARST